MAFLYNLIFLQSIHKQYVSFLQTEFPTIVGTTKTKMDCVGFATP